MRPDPADMLPDDRRRAVAALFAAAVRRLADRHALPDGRPTRVAENLPASALATDPAESVTVHAG